MNQFHGSVRFDVIFLFIYETRILKQKIGVNSATDDLKQSIDRLYIKDEVTLFVSQIQLWSLELSIFFFHHLRAFETNCNTARSVQ